ncbi:hypothetical protein EHO58_11860 [Leptospira selangorensis]|uniref:hypothetical protein n=1 Tax=Leptospira selangorensis TaxID=2484982 RepID=UPI0010846664|nr:hypothetical protein [Leptospira selangorensis]TGK04586.1 hypothetical protein EHO58_11860 [Leptospira selangorensis]
MKLEAVILILILSLLSCRGVLEREYPELSNREKGKLLISWTDDSGKDLSKIRMRHFCLREKEIKDPRSSCEDIELAWQYDLRKNDQIEIAIPEGNYSARLTIRENSGDSDYSFVTYFGFGESTQSQCLFSFIQSDFLPYDRFDCPKLEIRPGKTTKVKVKVTSKQEVWKTESLLVAIFSLGLVASPSQLTHLGMEYIQPNK